MNKTFLLDNVKNRNQTITNIQQRFIHRNPIVESKPMNKITSEFRKSDSDKEKKVVAPSAKRIEFIRAFARSYCASQSASPLKNVCLN